MTDILSRIDDTRRPFARCPCGHLWLHHDIEEYQGDDSELCCVDGCSQAECPGRQPHCPTCNSRVEAVTQGRLTPDGPVEPATAQPCGHILTAADLYRMRRVR